MNERADDSAVGGEEDVFVVLDVDCLEVALDLDWRWLSTAGALTYPFYLLHQRIGYSMIRTAHAHTGLPAWVLIVGAVLVLLAAAWLVHRLVERPEPHC